MIFVSRSVRLKVSLGLSLALIVVLAPLNWLQYNLQRRAAMREMELLAATTGAIVGQGLEQAMLTNNRAAIQAIIDNVAQVPDVRSIYLLTSEAVVAASPDSLHNGEKLDQNDAVCQTCHQLPIERRPRGITAIDAVGQPVFRTMTPIRNRPACHMCHSPEDRLNGVFYMDFSMAGLNARLERGLRTAFMGSVTIIVLTASVLYLLLSWLIITPMEQVAQGIYRFSQNERAIRVPVQQRDEVGLLAKVFNDMADTIQTQEAEAGQLYTELETKDKIRRQLLARLITAREEERQHLAREIHDELGQLLTGLSLFLKLCQQAVPDNFRVAHDHLGKAKALVRDTIEQAHHIIARLRPPVLDDYGLVPALQEELSQRLVPLGIDTHLDVEETIEHLPPEVATTAFRIVQEALTNVIRHANAHQVCVQLQHVADGLTVTVEDDGVGLPDESLSRANGHQSIGILGMQERAGALGGRLQVSRRASQGTRVVLWLPLEGNDL